MSVTRRKSLLPRSITQKGEDLGGSLAGQLRHIQQPVLSSSSSAPSIKTMRARRASTIAFSHPSRSRPGTGSGLLPVVELKKPKTPTGPDKESLEGTTASPAKLPETAKKIDIQTQAFTLSRRYNLDFHEVSYMLKELHKSPCNLPNGGMEKSTFETFLMRLFEVKHIPQEHVHSAYTETKAGDGEPEVEKLLLWYRDNMFSFVASLNADQEKQQSSDMVKEIAQKHNISEVDLDKIKKKFDFFDTDKSGEIEFEEFEQMMGSLLGLKQASDVPTERINRFWREIDIDGNGSVDFGEFVEWYTKYFSDGSGGPLESFYGSFSPDVQRSKKLEADDDAARAQERAAGQLQSASRGQDLIDEKHRQALLSIEVRRRTTVE
eukprot:TRINITY_DN16326_c0_g1_i1.p1 TRINITY_DN16326_c0_g1~~TRINITY_DN16326_c0_g1_i1.p1  ORF type:complete len:378 (+),score=72.15 TRINITY_DN16326_c0_g1_i1:47-1180(+)